MRQKQKTIIKLAFLLALIITLLAILSNMIMNVILYTYTTRKKDVMLTNANCDNNPEFEKSISSIPDADFSIIIADSNKYQSNFEQLSVNSDDLFIPVIFKSKRKYEKKKVKMQIAKLQQSIIILDK